MKKKGLFIVFTIAMALVCTVGIGLVTKKDANEKEFLDDVNIIEINKQ